jgi:uncharacterized repeat protein (TIGR03803 family)
MIRLFCRGSRAALAAGGILLLSSPALAQVTFEPLVNLSTAFRGDGPAGGVIKGSDGAFYGITQRGGPIGGEFGKGTIYRMAADGTVTVLHEFRGSPDDIGPALGRLVEASDGNFYGLAFGGTSTSPFFCAPGVIFRITPTGDLSVVHTLAPLDAAAGAFPEGSLGFGLQACALTFGTPSYGLTVGADGNLYGTLVQGGASGGGTIFKLTMSGEFSVIHHLNETIGPERVRISLPTGLTLGSDGNFYGAAIGGGVLFRVTPAGVFTPLHDSLNEPEGGDIAARPVEGDDGNFYGFTRPDRGCGSFYRLTPAGIYTRLLTMPGDPGSPAGCFAGQPGTASVTKGADGNFYGVAETGAGPYGAVLRITPAGELTVLHVFSEARALIDGYYPVGALLQVSPGVFLGTTGGGGGSVVYRVTVAVANRAPVATDASLGLQEDLATSGVLSAVDPDANALTYTILSNGTKGVARVTDAATGAFIYTPNANENGADAFTFKVNDGAVDSNVATVRVSIAAVNDAPVALDGSLAVNAGASASGTLDATDIDSAALLRAIVANGAKGSAIVTNPATGAFTYIANAGTSGLDTFTFRANDGTLDSNIATVTVTITPTTPSCAPPVDVTARLRLNLNRPRLGAVSGHFTERIRIENRTGAPIAGPVSFVFDGLTPGTTIVGASGFTGCTAPSGSPFITVDLGDGVLNDRERLEFFVEYVNDNASAITYTPRVLAGPGSR